MAIAIVTTTAAAMLAHTIWLVPLVNDSPRAASSSSLRRCAEGLSIPRSRRYRNCRPVVESQADHPEQLAARSVLPEEESVASLMERPGYHPSSVAERKASPPTEMSAPESARRPFSFSYPGILCLSSAHLLRCSTSRPLFHSFRCQSAVLWCI